MMRAVPQIGEYGYERLAHDAYRTPAWVTEALCRNVELRGPIWECAAGEGDMAEALIREGYVVIGTDIRAQSHSRVPHDFLLDEPIKGFLSVVTNPPYKFAEAFIRRALEVTEPERGMVALLLDHGYDTASSRMDLFADHPAFYCKLTLTKRIKWIGLGDKASPRNNHAWFVWDWKRGRPPLLRWAR